MSAHYVYRVYDETGVLIYVGCTNHLFERLEFHASNAWWGHQAQRAVAKVYRDRPTALAAEREVISTERPRWNLMGSWKNNRDWTRQNFRDYVTATLHQPVVTSYTATHLANVARLYTARFGDSLPITAEEGVA